MLDNLERLKIRVSVVFILELVAIFVLTFLFGYPYILFGLILFVLNVAITILVGMVYENEINKKEITISRILGNDAKDAFLFGQVGLVSYDEAYMITWMSELFIERDIDFAGEKITAWLPEVAALLQGDDDVITVKYAEHIYRIVRKADAQVLFFQDITKEEELEVAYANEKVVLGLIHMDNYEETTQYEEERKIAMLDSLIRQPVVEWCKDRGMFLRRIKSDRYLVVLNEMVYQNIENERFSIMGFVRNQSQEHDLAITLSMAFARGTDDFSLLDEMVNNLLELAQSRGGDQVAIREYGHEVQFFGGHTEAQEKRSRVRVRIMAQTLRDLIEKSENVLIVGHKNADFDCMGAALGVSCIASSYQKTAYIINGSRGMEEKLRKAMEAYGEELMQRHHFIDEELALSFMNENTLVVMVDHHDMGQSGASAIIEKGKKVVVIDHHRRRADFTFNPVLVYIESSASSTSELITEFFPYQTNKVLVGYEEATIMFTGMVIDTNHFKNRTGSRTFEAAAELKKYGADPIEADELLKDTYAEFEEKTNILKYSIRKENGIIITPYKGKRILTRAMLSQIADMLLNVAGIEASFVIAKVSEQETAISARSNGEINVQRIMERMDGGGHFTAAALQRTASSVDELENELNDVLEIYFKEEKPNESNPT